MTRAAVHFRCIIVATLATLCFVVTFVLGMDGPATCAAVVVALALGGAIWAHHLEHEHERRTREREGLR